MHEGHCSLCRRVDYNNSSSAAVRSSRLEWNVKLERTLGPGYTSLERLGADRDKLKSALSTVPPYEQYRRQFDIMLRGCAGVVRMFKAVIPYPQSVLVRCGGKSSLLFVAFPLSIGVSSTRASEVELPLYTLTRTCVYALLYTALAALDSISTSSVLLCTGHRCARRLMPGVSSGVWYSQMIPGT